MLQDTIVKMVAEPRAKNRREKKKRSNVTSSTDGQPQVHIRGVVKRRSLDIRVTALAPRVIGRGRPKILLGMGIGDGGLATHGQFSGWGKRCNHVQSRRQH